MVDQQLPRLDNPLLEWDEETGVVREDFGKTICVPYGWLIEQPEAEDDSTSAWVYNRKNGIGIDANNRMAIVDLIQEDVTLPAGRYGLELQVYSHLDLNDGDAKLQVLFRGDDGLDWSTEIFVGTDKGDQTRLGEVIVNKTTTGTLTIRYTTVWASTEGELQVWGVKFFEMWNHDPDFVLQVGSTSSETMVMLSMSQAQYGALLNDLREMALMQARLRKLLRGG